MNTNPVSDIKVSIDREPKQPPLPTRQTLPPDDEAGVICEVFLIPFRGNSPRVHEICEDEE
ncbi:MAG: hypothetical protein HY074_01370 [Deltaproteobacteria bacterium]|nr:hypothetical protein [Deltaproteobacteria bacterium]